MTGPEWLAAARALASIEKLQTTDIHELLDYALDQALAISESKYGYIYYYDEDEEAFALYAWSSDVMEACRVPEPRIIRYELSATGIWAEVVRQRKPMIVNDYLAENPLKKGCPEGHVQLSRWMSVPIIIDDRIVAVAGVANRESDYREQDVSRLATLMDVIWSVAERMRSQAEASEQRESVRALTAKTAVAQQHERSRLAMQLHDEIGQPVAALLLYLQMIQNDSVQADARLQKAIDIARRALGASRALVSELSPQVFDEMGIRAALEWLATEAFGDRLHCTVKPCCDLKGISDESAILLFHAARELLHNVVTHSGTDRAELSWTCSNGNITLEVSDDGVGFDAHSIRHSQENVGLLGLRVRAEYLGGELVVLSQPGAGTLVRIVLPMTPEQTEVA